MSTTDGSQIPTSASVVVVGGGLAGLVAAIDLREAGQSVILLEASDRTGGRVRTDRVDGFTMDHGFQVLLTAYPACRQYLDYASLDLKAFRPGALIRMGDRFRMLGDPWREPSTAWSTVTNPAGTLADKLRIARLRSDSRKGSLSELYARNAVPTEERLRATGFSEAMIENFFRPFLGGVFLDPSLSVSSRMLEFVFRMFAEGDIAVPAKGMDQIAMQLSQRLGDDAIYTNTTVTSIESNGDRLQVRTPGDQTIDCDAVNVATTSTTAARLLDMEELNTEWGGTTNLYYRVTSPSAVRRLQDCGPTLMLRGDDASPIESAVVMSNVSAGYAPTDAALLSVSVDEDSHSPANGDDDELDEATRLQLMRWFAIPGDEWELLRIYRVPYGLPRTQLNPVQAPVQQPDGTGPVGVFLAGDYRETPSIQGAMNSGVRAAAATLEFLAARSR
ncbi:MAG: NAD(P)/FAD-dependent oxidoreductase [Planctomycetota bacterium]